MAEEKSLNFNEMDEGQLIRARSDALKRRDQLKDELRTLGMCFSSLSQKLLEFANHYSGSSGYNDIKFDRKNRARIVGPDPKSQTRYEDDYGFEIPPGIEIRELSRSFKESIKTIQMTTQALKDKGVDL